MPNYTYSPQRKDRLVAGVDTPLDEASMLTEPLADFERRMARQYPDWPQFVAWVEERRFNVFAIAAALLVAVVLCWLPASAQADPCEVCQQEWSIAECPCLPEAPEPEPPGGTIPPVAGIACIPFGDEPNISGCVDKVFLPMTAKGE